MPPIRYRTMSLLTALIVSFWVSTTLAADWTPPHECPSNTTPAAVLQHYWLPETTPSQLKIFGSATWSNVYGLWCYYPQANLILQSQHFTAEAPKPGFAHWQRGDIQYTFKCTYAQSTADCPFVSH